MHAALKFFDFPFKGAGGQGANKIGIKLPDRASDEFSGDENGFMEIMAALTRIPPQDLNTSLAQLDWVPVEDASGELAPLIDLTDHGNGKKSILQMLLPQQSTDNQAPKAPLPSAAGFLEINSAPGKNTGVLEMMQPPAEEQIKQAPSVETLPPSDVKLQPGNEGVTRAVPTQESVSQTVLTQVASTNLTSESELAQKTSKNAVWMNAVEGNDVADEETELSQPKGARLVLTDRFVKPAGQRMEQATVQVNKESLLSDPQPMRSDTLKKLAGNNEQGHAKRLSGEPLGRQTVLDSTNSTAQPIQTEGSDRTIQEKTSQQNDRFVSMVSNRQAAPAQKASGESIAVAQELGLRTGEKVKQQQLNQSVRIDTSQAVREKVFAVTPSEGTEMQMNSNSAREGAPSFDSQLTATGPKAVESSASAKEAMPFVEKDTQTDVIRQIVQRMTLRTDRQQSQMVIRLKPDFLGNVRIQVTTEGQQVMVRMDAETAMVKDIVEQNMAHLKAELHQHGLEIEKFDVFVGNDNDGARSGQQQTGFRQTSKRSGQQFNGAQSDEESDENTDESDRHVPKTRAYSNNEVDYFV